MDDGVQQLIEGLPNAVTMVVASMTFAVVGFAWLHHTLGMDEILGEARWRYRERGRIDALKRTIESLVEVGSTRTFGWWATRIEFALAAGALVVATGALASVAGDVGGRPLEGPVAALTVAGFAGIVFGIRWMRRIYLSPLELDPEIGFRYRI